MELIWWLLGIQFVLAVISIAILLWHGPKGD
jgi:hypothetical protein